MLSLTATTLKPSILSLFTQPKPNGLSPHPITRPANPSPFTVSANLIPASNRQAPAKQNLYQPFRPPPSPIPPKFRSLDTAGKIEVLADRMGLWFEYAPLISSLYTEGFTPPTIEELTGISGVEQNCLIVGAQVRDSIVQSNAKPELIAAFETGGAELLYEIRRLSTVQRVAAAEYIVEHGFDTKGAHDLARAIKDYPHRRGDKGWEEFDYNLPGDCLSFMLYRKSREHRSPSELRTTLLEQAFEVAVTEKAKKAVGRELHGYSDEERAKEEEVKIIRVPVVRLKFGEVAGASSVVVLPVCEAEEGVGKINEAPMEFESGGEFGVVEAEKEWRRWVVLPGWDPVVAVRRGGVAVSFRDDRKVLPWNGKEEAIMVVMDREKKTVEAEDGYYLVVTGDGMKLERGSVLKERGVEECLGMVVLVVRPPRDDDDEWQINDDEWDTKKKAAEPLLVRLQRVSDARHADDYSLNKALRAQIRGHRKRVGEEEAASRKLGLGIRLLPKSEEDIAAASKVKFKTKFDKNRKDKRALIHASSIFPESSYSMSSSSKKRLELEAKRRKICGASASSLLSGGFKASSLSKKQSSASKYKSSTVSVRMM